MENERAMMGALIFILLIAGSNLIMYGIVRGMARGGDAKWMDALRSSFHKSSSSSSHKDIDELRNKIEKLQGKNKEEI